MERINQQKTEMKRRTSPESLPSVFISYSWANNDYINTVESAISRKANIYRDNKNIDSWSSINEFMKTIRKQDFALLFISDAYLCQLKNEYPLLFVNAAAWLMSVECIKNIGGFDTSLFVHYGEDSNFCQRMKYHDFKIILNTLLIIWSFKG